MGTSYEGLLVVGDRQSVVDALRAEDVIAVVAEVGPRRIAVIPREGPFDFAYVGPVAERVSGEYAMPVLAHWMSDSDVLYMSVYEAGIEVHNYVSEMAHVGQPVETDDGFVRVVDGVSYGFDDPDAPSGPRGADPDKFIPFGVGDIDRGQLERLLVSAANYVFADNLHAEIIQALHLDAGPLTTAFRWIEAGDWTIADAVRVGC